MVDGFILLFQVVPIQRFKLKRIVGMTLLKEMLSYSGDIEFLVLTAFPGGQHRGVRCAIAW